MLIIFMSQKEGAGREHDLAVQHEYMQAGRNFGEERYRRITSSEASSDIPSHNPLYITENLHTMEPELYKKFMWGAENKFQDCATEDLMKQGVPKDQAAERAFSIASDFGRLENALYKNKLGVWKTPSTHRTDRTSQNPRKPQRGK